MEFLDLGNIFVQASTLDDLQLELVTIADIGDKKAIKKLHGKMAKVLHNHSDIFPDWDKWDGNISIFQAIDQDVFRTISGLKHLFSGSFDDFNRSEKEETVIDDESTKTQRQQEEDLQKINNLLEQIEGTEISSQRQLLIIKLHAQSEKIALLAINSKLHAKIEGHIAKCKKIMEKFKSVLEMVRDAAKSVSESLNSSVIGVADFRVIYVRLYTLVAQFKELGLSERAAEYKNLALFFRNPPQDFATHSKGKIQKLIDLPKDIESYID